MANPNLSTENLPPRSYENALDKEQAYHFRAFTDYLAMGEGRSLSKLTKKYIDMKGVETGDGTAEKPPTTTLRQMEKWSARFRWSARVLQKVEDDARSATSERDTIRDEWRRRVVDDEWQDYEIGLKNYRELQTRTKIHETRTKQTRRVPKRDAQGREIPGQEVEIEIITVELNTSDHLRLAQLRRELSLQARRAASLPERYTAADVTQGGSVNIVFTFPPAPEGLFDGMEEEESEADGALTDEDFMEGDHV